MNGIRSATNVRQSPPRPARDSRLSTTLDPNSRGFTLVELMVVIVIIAVLVGMLLPAIFGAMRAGRVADVRTDISQLDQGITTFQAEYGGVSPPSRITLYEAGQTWDARSRAIIRRIWPQFNFGLDRDFDGDGTAGEAGVSATLNGAECLVFFLGGIAEEDSNGRFRMTGFSKNPARPFATGGNRAGPFFEFKSGRLVDLNSDNGFPEYLDPLPSQTSSPYLYLSSYDGRGYRQADVDQITTDVSSTFTSWYTQAGGSEAHRPNAHQIISPGEDGRYGTGGVYDPDTADTDLSNTREDERDNIANFSRGRLVP